LDYFEICCNFTPDEQTLLNLRAQGKSQEDCAELMSMGIATIKRLENKIQRKIQRES
jgi:DNA-binding CsgD family transcriptional regulator